MPETNDVISHLYYDLNDKINSLETRLDDSDLLTTDHESRLDAIDVADATEPKVYVALLSQTGTDAPVATVFKNTLGGTVVWTYINVGFYTATIVGGFSSTNTNIIYNPFNIIAGDGLISAYITPGVDEVRVQTYFNEWLGTYPTSQNDFLNDFFIKIEVYP